MNKIKTTALAAALVAMSTPASSAVIATNADGWEISFGGFINLFANFYDNDGGNSEVHLQEGLLPAFATFKAKSPTVNGLTGTAQITFAPDSSASKGRRQDKGGGGISDTGTAIDMREVFFNVEGSFGTFSAGRTLGIFSRQAILKDQTLFGVGSGGTGDGGGTTLGRIGAGYVYPAFDTRFSYKTPDMNGFQVEIGLYDPLEEIGGGGATSTDTSIPRVEVEATYGTTFGAGSANFWLGGLWQESDDWAVAGNDRTHTGIDVGAQVMFGGFEAVGHYTDGENLGQVLKITAPGLGVDDEENTHWYAQLGYTFAGATKVALSYGESESEIAGATNTRELFTVGVYHDVNSWLKLVAEYNDFEIDAAGTSTGESDVFSVGAFLFW